VDGLQRACRFSSKEVDRVSQLVFKGDRPPCARERSCAFEGGVGSASKASSGPFSSHPARAAAVCADWIFEGRVIYTFNLLARVMGLLGRSGSSGLYRQKIPAFTNPQRPAPIPKINQASGGCLQTGACPRLLSSPTGKVACAAPAMSSFRRAR